MNAGVLEKISGTSLMDCRGWPEGLKGDLPEPALRYAWENFQETSKAMNATLVCILFLFLLLKSMFVSLVLVSRM